MWTASLWCSPSNHSYVIFPIIFCLCFRLKSVYIVTWRHVGIIKKITKVYRCLSEGNLKKKKIIFKFKELKFPWLRPVAVLKAEDGTNLNWVEEWKVKSSPYEWIKLDDQLRSLTKYRKSMRKDRVLRNTSIDRKGRRNLFINNNNERFERKLDKTKQIKRKHKGIEIKN